MPKTNLTKLGRAASIDFIEFSNFRDQTTKFGREKTPKSLVALKPAPTLNWSRNAWFIGSFRDQTFGLLVHIIYLCQKFKKHGKIVHV